MHHKSLNMFNAFVGIDWADKKHDICIQSADNSDRQFITIPHTVEDLNEWAISLYKQFKGPIAIAIELQKGPIISVLQKYEFIVIFPIHPTTLAKYREAFNPSGAKDDPTDAEIALELMQRYPDNFKPLDPQSPLMRKLGYLVEHRRKLVDEKRACVNRLIITLKQYYPQLLDLFSHRDTTVFSDLIIRWPTLQQLKRARKTTLETFFKEHNTMSDTLFEKRYAAIKEATPLTEDSAIVDSHKLFAISIASQIVALNKSIKLYDLDIDETFSKHADADLFKSLPSAGQCFAPRLLVAFGEQRERFKSASEVQRYTGIAPVTERSGNKEWVHWRWRCPKFTRQTFIEWSEKTVRSSFWAGKYYQQQRAKGANHQVAIRALAFKWIRIIFSCWKNQRPYDESTYLKSLNDRGSSLLAA